MARQAAPAAVPRYIAKCSNGGSGAFSVAVATSCFRCCEELCLRVEPGTEHMVRDLMLMCKVRCSEHCGW
jgi:hypothetical protein